MQKSGIVISESFELFFENFSVFILEATLCNTSNYSRCYHKHLASISKDNPACWVVK